MSVLATAAKEPVPPFPTKSFLLFAAGGILAWFLSVAVLAWFPGANLFPTIARVVLQLLVALGLLVLNRKLLVRDGFAPQALGLHPRRAGWLLVGASAMAVLIVAIVGALWLLVPFHYERGSMSAGHLGLQAAQYFSGNFAEELLFRGYLLIVLQRHLGLGRALLTIGVLFGLFHCPGLAPLAAAKMACTTFVGSCLFAYGFLLTRALWTAVGLHVAGNTLLHHVAGLSGQKDTLWRPVFDAPWPSRYDPGFLVYLFVTGAATILAAVALNRRLRRAEPVFTRST